MKITIHTDNDELLACYENHVWVGTLSIIPQVVHILIMSMRNYPHQAFQKATGLLPRVDAKGVEDGGLGKTDGN